MRKLLFVARPPKRSAQKSATLTRRTLLAGLVTLAVSCEELRGLTRSSEDEISRAQFGVFYGSQIREKEEIPFELDPSKQQLGFRIEFLRPLEQPREIHWELSKPGKQNPKRPTLSSPAGRVTKLAFETVPAGAQRFEQTIHMRPGDPLGVWNIRVTQGKKLLIDRPFLVFDRRARKRARAATRALDAGN